MINSVVKVYDLNGDLVEEFLNVQSVDTEAKPFFVINWEDTQLFYPWTSYRFTKSGKTRREQFRDEETAHLISNTLKYVY